MPAHTSTANLHLSLQRCVHAHVCMLKKTALDCLDFFQLCSVGALVSAAGNPAGLLRRCSPTGLPSSRQHPSDLYYDRFIRISKGSGKDAPAASFPTSDFSQKGMRATGREIWWLTARGVLECTCTRSGHWAQSHRRKSAGLCRPFSQAGHRRWGCPNFELTPGWKWVFILPPSARVPCACVCLCVCVCEKG